MIDVALVGAGRVAALHADAIRATTAARVAAVVDPRAGAAEALAAAFGAEVLPDLGAVLARPDLAAVVVAAPHDLHASMATAVLQAGRHLFLDKPLATDVSAAEAVARLAARTPARVMVCHNLLFHPALQLAAERLAELPLGRLVSVAAWSHGWLDLPPWDFRRSREATGGGAWVDGAGHLLYAIERLAEPVADIRPLFGDGASRLGGEDNAAAAIRLRSGATGTVQVSYADRLPGAGSGWPAGWRIGIRLSGTQGSLELTLLPRAAVSVSRGGGAARVERVDAAFEASFRGAMSEFVSAITEDRDPAVGPEDALRILRLLDGSR